MKKFLYVLFIFLFIFSINSCGKKDNDDDNNPDGNKNNPGGETIDYLSIINKPLTNATFENIVVMKMNYNGNESDMNGKMTLKQDGDRSYMVSEMLGMTSEEYTEKVGDSYKVYSKSFGDWTFREDVSTPEQQMPIAVFKEGDFKYENGVLIGNVAKLQDTFASFFTETDDAEGFTLTKYDITIKDGYISEIKMLASIESVEGTDVMKANYDYTIKISNIGSTSFDRPAGLPDA